VAKKGDNPGAAPEDPNAPVLSLPLTNSTQDEKGTAAAIDENVKCGGAGQGCVFDTNSQLAIADAGNLSGDAGSISFCFQPQWAGSDQVNASLVDLRTPNEWSNHLKVFKNGVYFRFSLWPSDGPEAGVSANISSWQPGQWHPVTVTYGPDPQTGQNMMSMYLDGTLIGQQPYESQLQVPDQPLYIGSDVPGGQPGAGGSLMNFQAYNRVLGGNDITNFANGCP
jgi:hypothetical protein